MPRLQASFDSVSTTFAPSVIVSRRCCWEFVVSCAALFSHATTVHAAIVAMLRPTTYRKRTATSDD